MHSIPFFDLICFYICYTQIVTGYYLKALFCSVLHRIIDSVPSLCRTMFFSIPSCIPMYNKKHLAHIKEDTNCVTMFSSSSHKFYNWTACTSPSFISSCVCVHHSVLNRTFICLVLKTTWFLYNIRFQESTNRRALFTFSRYIARIQESHSALTQYENISSIVTITSFPTTSSTISPILKLPSATSFFSLPH